MPDHKTELTEAQWAAIVEIVARREQMYIKARRQDERKGRHETRTDA
jgi:hypothetical protein